MFPSKCLRKLNKYSNIYVSIDFWSKFFIRFHHIVMLIFAFRFFSFAELLSCRQVLNIMVILGFMLNYALRVNLTIAIVAMVEDPTAKPTSISSINFNATALHANETATTLAESVSSRIHTHAHTPYQFRSIWKNLNFCFFCLLRSFDATSVAHSPWTGKR